MEIKEVSNKGYKCIKCMNHKVNIYRGGLVIDIDCKLLDSSLFLYREDIIKDCENFITDEQYSRKRKLNKLCGHITEEKLK